MISNGNVAGIYLKQKLGYESNFNIASGNDPSYAKMVIFIPLP